MKIYFLIFHKKVSPNDSRIAFISLNIESSEYFIGIYDINDDNQSLLASIQVDSEIAENALCWSNDEQSLFFLTQHKTFSSANKLFKYDMKNNKTTLLFELSDSEAVDSALVIHRSVDNQRILVSIHQNANINQVLVFDTIENQVNLKLFYSNYYYTILIAFLFIF